MENIFIGAAYYPELWDYGEIAQDIERCKALGINCLRIGEFAWSTMEPEEGKFDIEPFKRIIDELYANGIYTVMCTPTCTPPRWMLNKYEEMRRVDSRSRRVNVSSRCHVCKTSPIARRKNKAIVTELAKALHDCKGIIGWQIDNEIFPYDEGCYCPNCKQAFRDYLKTEFGLIDNLNKAWGMKRWSLDYVDFSEVEPPYPDEWRHPSLRKAWWDFQCAQIKSFVDEQADILYEYGCGNVGTDMMKHNWLSYYDVNRKLDIVQFNHYDAASELSDTVFSYDFLRCIKDKPFWVTETQAGWNGSEYADCGYRPVGNCYINTWLPIIRGAEMNMYWLFRAHPSGHELAHGALYSSAGRVYRVSSEVKRAAADIEKCEKLLTATHIRSDVALHYSSVAANCFSSAPVIKGFDYRKTLIENYHKQLRHYNVDVIDTPHSLDTYKVVLSPFLAVADKNDFIPRIIEWIKNGGTWIVGPMSDIMNENVVRFTNAPYGSLEDLAGVFTVYQKPVHNDVFKAQWNDGTNCDIGMCFDAYEPQVGTSSIVKYVGDEFDGLSAVTERVVGKGRVISIGSAISGKDLMRLVNLPPIAEASANVVLTLRTGVSDILIAAETENKSGYIKLDGKYRDILSDKIVSGKVKIAPYSILVLLKSN